MPAFNTAPIAGLALAAALSGCGGSGFATSSDRPVVAAAFYPLAFVAERVGGDRVDVDNLTTPGAEPHDLELGLPARALINDAAIIVFQRGFQPAVDDAVDDSPGATVVDAAEAVELRPAESHGEEHGGFDPHFWLDPLLLADLGDELAESMTETDPEGKDEYRANADDLRRQLTSLDREYATRLDSCNRSVVVVSHDAFGYLERYGLRFEPIAGLSPDAEPAAAQLPPLAELADRKGVTTVFSETLASPKLADALAGDLGISTALLDPLEGLVERDGTEDYLGVMRDNLTALAVANDC
jgi:zinc transport system substrate-binding protein